MATAYADVGTSSIAKEDTEFNRLVLEGDEARLAHRLSAALNLYNKALDIRRDPSVDGRIGLIYADTGHYAWAAEYLLRAITKGQASPRLMKQFHEAFARVRPKVCFVEVFVSEPTAAVFIDDKQEPQSGLSAFHVFVTGGTHTYLAKRDGFEDAITTLESPAGGELEVRLDLKPVPSPPSVQVAPMPNLEPVPSPVKPSRRLSDSYLHFYLGTGPVVVLGAGPGVSVGPQMIFGFRRKFFSLNLDARVAWATGSVKNAPELQLMTWAVGLRPCGHIVFLFGCGVVQLDGLESLSASFESQAQARFGGGGRVGVDVGVGKSLRLQVWGEGIGRATGNFVRRNSLGYWNGSKGVGGFGAAIFLTW